MTELKKIIADKLCMIAKEKFNSSPETQELAGMFEYPPEQKLGDLALPCFKLSRSLRRSPAEIASVFAESFADESVEKADAVNGYLNFFISDGYRIKMLSKVLAAGDSYGSSKAGEGKTMCIDYSSPNIAKPFHIGHLGTTAIGNSIKRIHAFSGYNCIGINHLGDWGTQFGRLIVAYKTWGSKERVIERGVKELADIYKEFYIRAETDPSLNDQARAAFTALENGDEELLALWQWFKDISIAEFMRLYDRLGIKFESYSGESFYNDKMEAVVEELREKGLLKESDGAMIVDLEEYKMPPCLILKKDGSTLYATRDITAAIYRRKTYNFDKCVYVTDAGQSLHFAQWFKVIGLMGYDFEDKLVHVPYGKISVSGQKLATRTGNVVLLEDLFNEAISRAREIIEQKNPNLEDKDEIARKVGMGAVIFNQLSNNRIKDINFIMDEALNFDGNTGPYIQYTYARTSSVLAKAGEIGEITAAELLEDECALINCLSLFPDMVDDAREGYEPSVISRYLITLSQTFNRFYHNCPVLKSEGAVRNNRLALCKATRTVLANAMYLIGMETTENI